MKLSPQRQSEKELLQSVKTHFGSFRTTIWIQSKKKCYVDKNENLLRSRKIEQSEPDDSTNRPDMDVVMEETVVLRALSAQESKSLVDLTLSPAEVQMNNTAQDAGCALLRSLQRPPSDFMTMDGVPED